MEITQDYKTMEEIIKDIKMGNERQKEKLFKMVEKLLTSITKKYLRGKKPFEEIFQVACLGFLKAIRDFKPEIGVRFTTYLYAKTINEIKVYYRSDNYLHISRVIADNKYRISAIREKFLNENGREATRKEVAKILKVTEKEVEEIIKYNSFERLRRFDKKIKKDSEKDMYLKDVIKDKNNPTEENIINNLILNKALNTLDAKQKKVISLRYLQGLTQKEVGKLLKVAQVTISRYEKEGMRKLREYFGIEVAKKERADRKINNKEKAFKLFGQGYNNIQVQNILMLQKNTIIAYRSMYNKGLKTTA